MKHTIIKKALCAALILTLSASSIFAQTTVKGTVRDAKGEAVPGAVVMLEGSTTVGTVTDHNGNYVLTIPSSAKAPKLSFSCIGFNNISVEVGKNSVINAVFEEDSTLLDEVVVVGYGSMRKSDLTGSVASVKVDENEASRSASFDQILQGKAAGVEVINTTEEGDAGVSIRIRGVTSLNGSSEPLYVVDGVILTEPSESKALSSTESESVNGLMGINPQDIASIEILKDASATAIYGAAGANGVVLITTKEATKEKPTVQFNAGVDINTPYGRLDVMDFYTYYDFVYDRKQMGDGTYAGNICSQMKGTDGEWKRDKMDWQNKYFQNYLRQRYFISISGRPNTFDYRVSFGVNKSGGMVPSTNTDQYTARFNANKSFFKKKLVIGTSINFSYINSSKMQGAGNTDNGVSSSFIKSMVRSRPYYYFESDIEDEDEELFDTNTYSKSTPNKWINDTRQTRNEYRIIPNFKASWTIIPELTLKTSVGADYHMRESGKYRGMSVTRSKAEGGVSNSERYNINWDTTLNFNKKWKKHTLNAMLGYSASRNVTNEHITTSTEIIQYGTQLEGINSSSSNETSLSFYESATSKQSVFTRLVYNFSDRYVVTGTFRVDGSSIFDKENRFANFPSFAAAWRINQEPWFKVKVISMLKLRAGWGMVGNCSASPYQTLATYSSFQKGYHFNDAYYVTGLSTSTTMRNKELKWETTNQVNLGLDFGMWDGRLTLTADAYYKRTHDLLQSRSIPYTSGFTTMWSNCGEITNKGLEFTLDATPVATKDIEWSIGGNLSMNRNRLEDIGYDREASEFYFEKGVQTMAIYDAGQSIANQAYMRGATNITIVGQPIGLFYGYKTMGMVKEGQYGVPSSKANYDLGKYQQPGQVNYVDMDGNGYIDEKDKTVIGNANPDFTYGFSTRFRWKHLSVGMNFYGVYGNQLMNGMTAQLSDTHLKGNPGNLYIAAYKNAWTTANPNEQYNIFKGAETYGLTWDTVFDTNEQEYITDRYIEDGSYLRMSSINVSYYFNLPKQSPLQRIEIGATVSNPFTWTKYSGFSPVVSSYNITSKRIGVDNGGYPASRAFCFDLKLTF